MRRILALSASCLLLSGCFLSPGLQLNTAHTYQAAPYPKPKKLAIVPITRQLVQRERVFYNNYEYQVGPTDVLNITVWDHPELTIPQGQFRSAAEAGTLVDAQGYISYPFVNRLRVRNLTVGQIGTRLSHQLAKYIRNPQVTVRVAEFDSRKVQVLGAVNKPTTEPITNVPLSLIDAINAAGSFSPVEANTRRVFVIRGPINQPTIFWLNANDPQSLLLANQFYLRDHDVVYVSTAGVVSWNKFLSNILPSVQGWWTVNQVTK